MFSKFPLPVAIFVTYLAMLTMSTIAFWAHRPATEPGEGDFASGFQEGFATAAVSGTLVSAIIFGVIAGLRRTRATFVAALILVIFAACHLGRFVATFPSLDDAAWSLAPNVAHRVFLSPINWLNYFIIFRAYCELRTEAVGSSFGMAEADDGQE